MYAGYLALYATLAGVRGHGSCARIRCSALLHTYVQRTHTGACIHYRISLSAAVHDAHDARAPFALACPARKSRVHALLRARVCSVCVCRVPQRTERWTGEKEYARYHSVSLRDDTHSCNLLVIPLGRTAEDSPRYRPRNHTRINYAARFIGQRTVARPALARNYVIFIKSRARREPVPSRVSPSNLNETRGRKFGRRSPAL